MYRHTHTNRHNRGLHSKKLIYIPSVMVYMINGRIHIIHNFDSTSEWTVLMMKWMCLWNIQQGVHPSTTIYNNTCNSTLVWCSPNDIFDWIKFLKADGILILWDPNLNGYYLGTVAMECMTGKIKKVQILKNVVWRIQI